jgi:hypothetical protein
MANIVISELRPAGAELFDGSESFMSDLTDSELDATKGASSPICVGWFIVGSVGGLAIGLLMK